MDWLILLVTSGICAFLVAFVLLVVPRLRKRRIRKDCEEEFGVRLPSSFDYRKMKGHDRYILSWNGKDSFLRIHNCVIICYNPVLLIFLVESLRKRGRHVPLCHDEYVRMKKLSKQDKLSLCYLRPYDASTHYDIDEFSRLYNEALSESREIRLI